MTELAGSLVTFDGNPDQMYLVTPNSVISAAQETDPNIANFLQVAVGTACPGTYSSAADIIIDAQAAGDEIGSGGNYIPPCTWLRRYAPFLLAADFQTTGIEVDFNSGTWLLQATFLRLFRERTFAIPSNNCWETVDTFRSFYYNGPRPVVIGAHLNEPYCFYPQGASTFSTPDGGIFGSPQGERDFKNGSSTIVLVSPDTTRVTRDNLTGTPFMPIPPIPDGYPAAPPAPPLTGQIASNQISDDVAHDICIRGGAFLTWWDIGNRAPNQEPGELEWMQTKTQVLGIENIGVSLDIVQAMEEATMRDIATIVVTEVVPAILVGGTVAIAPELGAAALITWLIVDGTIALKLLIPQEAVQDAVNTLAQLYVPQCVGANPPDKAGFMRLFPVPFPVASVDGASQLEGFQAICDALYSLLRCCPPCFSDNWVDAFTTDAVYDWLPGTLPSAVAFALVESKYEENASMGGQLKLGYFKWLLHDDENPGLIEAQEPIWVNTDTSVFFAKNGLVRGLRWVPQNGVTVKVVYKVTDLPMGLHRFSNP